MRKGMYEVLISLPALSLLLFGGAGAWTGLPVGLGALLIAWHAGALPESVYPLELTSAAWKDAAALAVLVDGMQFCIHYACHAANFGAHNVHHRALRPTAADAFRTGVADALLQLVLPVYAGLLLLAPCRLGASCFGVGYGLWLQWIHCDVAWGAPLGLLVTPDFHRTHHSHPATNFGHLLTIWDLAAGTARTSRTEHKISQLGFEIHARAGLCDNAPDAIKI